MEISFIIIAYNEEKYIEKCVRSVFLQKNLPSFEVIVVDNNSTDNTYKIVREKFPQAKLVKELKQGMTSARNRGAKEAKGDILVFFDADDIIPEHWAEKMLMYFKKHVSCVGISGPSKFYDLPKRYKFVEFIGFKILYPFFGEFLLKTVFKKGVLWNGANIAVKKWAFRKVGGFSEDILFYGEDSDLAERLMKTGPIAFVQDLWVFGSARRLLKGNPILEGFKYISNYMWFFLTKKSRGKYKAVR